MNPQTNNVVIEINALTKSFGKQVVLNKISLQLMKGENLVVLGKSGSGKSVLAKCIIGLLPSDSGELNVLGENVLNMNAEALNKMRKNVGFLFQSGALYDSMTVRQNLAFPLTRIRKDWDKAAINAKINEVLNNVGLLDAIDKMPSELSGGMRKRISLARTIIVDPSIILYDEPTTGLDPVTSHEISSLILAVQQKYSTSSLIITHDMKCATKVANRIIMIKAGEVYKIGTVDEFENDTDPEVKAYFQ